MAVRGDDDVFALLTEMSGNNATPKSNDILSTTSSSSLLRTSGNDNIVARLQSGTRVLTARHFQLGCNPHVEIIRHRQHEKFKASFNDLFRAQCSSSAYSNTNKSDKTGNENDQQQLQQQQRIIRSTMSTIWKSIPPHTIWERFQFSLKTLEAECVRELTTLLADSSSNETTNHSTIATLLTTQQPHQQQQFQYIAFPTVHQLHSHMVHSRNRGSYWEPLLPVSSIMNYASSSDGSAGEYVDNDLTGRKMNERYRNESLLLLRGEIEFQFRRVFKKVVGNSKGKDVSTLFLQLGGSDGGGDVGKKKRSNKKWHSNKKFKDEKDGEHCSDDAKKNSNDNEEKHDDDDGEEKEDYILRTIFASQPFQKITLKLHKKFFHLAEDTYCAFLVEIQKCSNRLLEEEQKQASSHVHGRKKKKQQRKDYHGMPRITRVINDNVDDDNINNDDDDIASEEMDQQVKVTLSGISLRINNRHREKLMSLYKHTLTKLLRMKREIEFHDDDDDPDTNAVQVQQQYNQLQEEFPKLLFSLLLRYDALEGAGLQSAIPPTVFRYLQRRFECEFECFASPFNCYWLEKDDNGSGRGGGVGGRYGSAYGDTDAMFGSFGSFFDLDFLNLSGRGIRGGCYQANPPFASEFIEKMYHRMHHFLTVSEHATEGNEVSNKKVEDDGEETDNIPLMFVVFVPAWSKCSGWRMLSSSPYLTIHILLKQKEDVHYYAEGTQHRRKRHHRCLQGHDGESGKEGHRIASFDTSVFFLQNAVAKAKWPIIGEDEKLIKDAFAIIPTDVDDDNDDDEKKKCTKNIHRGKTTKQYASTPQVPSCRGKSTGSGSKIAPNASLLAMKRGSAKRKKKKSDKAAPKVKGGGENGRGTATTQKKTRLMTGGQDELCLLASMGILYDDGAK